MKLIICGDSFGVADPEYGTMWAELLADRLGSLWEIVNLSQVGASNMLISLQVDHAVELAADAVIVHFTSCTRETYRARESELSLLEQFQDRSLIPYVIPTCTTLEPYLDLNTIDSLRRHYLEYSDLDCVVYTNKCIIESVLYRLRASEIAWAWDQGGFEHHSFGADCDYFEQFNGNRTGTCLWDYADSRAYRPYYHITDSETHSMIADHYASWIKDKI